MARDAKTHSASATASASEHDHRLKPARPMPADAAPRWLFARGSKRPRGVAWFGVRSFWGHLQHLIASAIATEDIDSRDWMHADPPARFAEQIADQLGLRRDSDPPTDDDEDRASPAGSSSKPSSDAAHTSKRPRRKTVTEAIGRDLWIDFLADTGDDVSVSEAVGKLFTAEYEVPDLDTPGAFLTAPRGDILLMGGDVAYPVATATEIHDRVVVPFNKSLVSRRDSRRRVLLGVPGNHDWYDGLDGFARMFRKRTGEFAAQVDKSALTPTHETRLEHVAEFVEQFVVGGRVAKRKALNLDGYVPMQHASYFALPLAPGLDLFAADRQLRAIDFRQRRYFAARRREASENRLMVLLPDPVYAFLEPSHTGVPMAQALGVTHDLGHTPYLFLSGDIHHYERRNVGAATHVIAGGGGAFLHPARIARKGLHPPVAEWPGVAQCKILLRQVPWQVAAGRSGYLPHLILFGLYAPALGIGRWMFGTHSATGGSIAGGIATAIACAWIGGLRTKPTLRLVLLSALAGTILGLIPGVVALAGDSAWHSLGARPESALLRSLAYAFPSVLLGALTFGAFLASLTRIGQENTQAFTALGHPGFKHFLRMRVHEDGSAIDAWCIGLQNPLAKHEKPVLVDHFRWRAR